MKNFRIFIPLLFLLTLTESTCTYDVQTPDVCFREDVLPIFVSKCATTGCHDGNMKEGNYTNYDGIMKDIVPGHPFKSEAFTEINSGEMPPRSYGKLSKYERSIIKNWIKMGAPNSSNCTSCDTIFTYSKRIRPLVDKWCTGCHNNGLKGGGYDLSGYSGLVSSIINNRLMGSLNQQSGYSGMPQNVGKLSDCDLKAINNWVNAGHPEN